MKEELKIEKEPLMRTFQQWSNLGYKILAGSRATRLNGVCMFSEKQVIRYHPGSGRIPYLDSPNRPLSDDENFGPDY